MLKSGLKPCTPLCQSKSLLFIIFLGVCLNSEVNTVLVKGEKFPDICLCVFVFVCVSVCVCVCVCVRDGEKRV